jgi:6-phosphogluconolactonase (cycloisomerase 2 family)
MRKNMGQSRSPIVALVGMLFLAGCSAGSPTTRPTAPAIQAIAVSPTTASITAGTTQQFTARATYSDGSVRDVTNLATWSSSETAAATINDQGVALGLVAATTSISASTAGVTSPAASLHVNQLVAITITPENPTIFLGRGQQFHATGTYKNSDGSTTTADITAQVTWSSGSVTTASITSSGFVSSAADGDSMISAVLDSVTGQTLLAVSAPVPESLIVSFATPTVHTRGSVTATVQEKWTDGSLHAPSGSVVWNSNSPKVAGVVATSTKTASVRGLAPGTPSVTATEGPLVSNSAPIQVVTGTNASNPYSIGEYTVTATASPYLTSLGTAPTIGFSPQQAVLDPNGQYLYLLATSNNLVATLFNVNSSTGVLTQSSGSPMQVSAIPDTSYSIIDPYGRFLYVAELTNNLVYAFQIDSSTGALTAVAGSPFSANVSGPVCLIEDLSGQYLYVINLGNATISGYTIDQTLTATGGAITPFASNATIATGSSPGYSTLDPTGTYIYVPDSLANTVTTYAIGSGGGLTNTNTTTAIAGATALWNVAADPSGKYLYVLDVGDVLSTPQTNGAVYQFNLTSGIPGTAPVGSPVSTGVYPNGIVVDPTSSLVAVENAGNANSDTPTPSTISLFTIGTGGALTAQTPVPTGIGPFFVTFYNVP